MRSVAFIENPTQTCLSCLCECVQDLKVGRLDAVEALGVEGTYLKGSAGAP